MHMLYIIGLGNPGEKYTYTRHNVAWLILDSVLGDIEWSLNKYMNAYIFAGDKGLYIKPQTFMNKSGEVISFLQQQYNLEERQVIVIHDDVDLPFGNIRIAVDRGDGGHNGARSIMDHLGSKKFIRIRIGVSLQLEDRLIKPNVLGVFPESERIFLGNELAIRVGKIIDSIDTNGLQKTMNIFNTKQG